MKTIRDYFVIFADDIARAYRLSVHNIVYAQRNFIYLW